MRRRSREPDAPEPAPPAESRLGGLRPMAHDEDERPTREDRASDRTMFDLPGWLPKFLTRGKTRASD
jgi:hypothetical protein